MTDNFNDNLSSLAEDIRAIGADLRFSLVVQLLNAGWLLYKYITMKARTYGQNRSRFDIMHTLIIHGGLMKPVRFKQDVIPVKTDCYPDY